MAAVYGMRYLFPEYYIILFYTVLYYTVLYYTVQITIKIKLVGIKPKTLIDTMHNRNKKHPKLKGDDHIRISEYEKKLQEIQYKSYENLYNKQTAKSNVI